MTTKRFGTRFTTIGATVLLASGLTGAAWANEPAAQPAVGDAKAGATKANTICIACHGPMGNSVVPAWPKLAGQNPEYIQKQLMDFKAGRRQNAQMTPMAAPLTDQDVLNVAAFFSAQTQNGGTADPALAKVGEQIYRAGIPANGVPACSGCHGPAGMGNDLAKFPRISGQHADYAKQTLTWFRDGTRANDPNGMMRGVAARMTDKEIAAVSQYIQGLKP
jgi:cytochrome c553